MSMVSIEPSPSWAVMGRLEDLTTPDVPFSIFPQAEFNPRYNDVGTFAITLPSSSHVAQTLRNPGSGLVFIRDGKVAMSGPVRSRSLEPKNTNQPEQWKFTGVDDTHVLRSALCWPEPSNLVTNQTVTHYEDSGDAETVLRNLVTNQIGSGAHPDKQIPNVIVETTNNNQGSQVSVRTRFGNLLDVMKKVARNGGVGFRIVQNGTSLEFQVYVPQDVSDVVQFSTGRKNLRKAPGYSVRAPELRSVVVGAGGEGTNRVFGRFIRDDAADWPWVYNEKFVDRRDLDPSNPDINVQQEMAEEAEDRLSEAGPSTSLTIDPIDVPGSQYGIDYEIGDIVAAQIAPGEQVVDIVRGVNMVLSESEGQKVTPTIGNINAVNQEVSATADLFKRILRIVRIQESQGARQ